ncbi:MAG: hypothetical protein R2747_11210 [Pyrinomonadaceae bacterium]
MISLLPKKDDNKQRRGRCVFLPLIMSVFSILILAQDHIFEIASQRQTIIGKSRFQLDAGLHILKIFAVDTGVVLDKIIFHSGKLKPIYFGPPETKLR